MLTIKKAKKSDWLYVDADFRSLQMCLAMADCGLNKNGIDKICYDVYGVGGSNDAHSTTMFSVFVEPVNTQVIEIENEKGEKKVFGLDQMVTVRRGGQETSIKGEDFRPDDEFISY